jgi:DNA helicase-2/ATP-dependent DNA helicase PcrA
LVARSTSAASPFARGDRVFHQKFGNGEVTAVDGNKLTIQFDRAGEKRVVDSFVTRV